VVGVVERIAGDGVGHVIPRGGDGSAAGAAQLLSNAGRPLAEGGGLCLGRVLHEIGDFGGGLVHAHPPICVPIDLRGALARIQHHPGPQYDPDGEDGEEDRGQDENCPIGQRRF